MSVLPFTNFTKGELAPELLARIDTSQYGAGAKKVRNFIIQRYGGLAFRPGFRFIGEVDNVAWEPRYVPFQFNIEQAYMLAYGDYSMRLLAQGGFVLEDNLNIIAITKSITAQVTAAFHGNEVGDRIYFKGILGMTELNNQFAHVVTVIDDDNFTIDIDTRQYTDFISSDGITRSGPPTPPPPPPTPTPTPTPPPPPDGTSGGGSGGNLGGFYGGGYIP